MKEVIIDTLLDTLKLVPFLFITYLVLDLIERKSSEKTLNMIAHAGTGGPLIGSLVGVIPQCGFSASAASLYSMGYVSAGTLIAVFLATSDEMLPIMLTSSVPASLIAKILICKAAVGFAVGIFLDKVIYLFSEKRNRTSDHLVMENCDCGRCGPFISSLKRTLQISAFILVVTYILNIIIYFIGIDTLSGLILNRPVIGSLISSAVGLIPNCAASVVITELYLSGAMTTGAMLSGLLSASGVGMLVLFRSNSGKLSENITFLAIMYASGVIIGIIVDLLGIIF